MVDELQVAIAFLLYLFVFGWIGWRRGMNRELIVLGVSLVTLIIVRLQGDILIRIANLGWQLFNMILAGGLSDSGATDTGTVDPLITTCSDTVTTCTAPGYLFLFWVTMVILAYLFGTLYVKNSPSNGWAILIGIANGFLYASVVLPRLFALINPDAVNLDEPLIIEALVGLIGAAWTSITDVVSELWTSMGALQPYILLLFLIILVVGAASTLRKA
jgi:hypothetical protein